MMKEKEYVEAIPGPAIILTKDEYEKFIKAGTSPEEIKKRQELKRKIEENAKLLNIKNGEICK